MGFFGDDSSKEVKEVTTNKEQTYEIDTLGGNALEAVTEAVEGSQKSESDTLSALGEVTKELSETAEKAIETAQKSNQTASAVTSEVVEAEGKRSQATAEFARGFNQLAGRLGDYAPIIIGTVSLFYFLGEQ